MKNLFEVEVMEEILRRINKLEPSSERQWGKMEVAQMLAHCTSSLRLANGERKPKRMLLGILIGSFFKSTYYDDKPFKKNAPTTKESTIIDKREFYKEKEILINKIVQFVEGGMEKCTKHPHPFFGFYTPEQWGIGIYKHLDHHLRQFNV